MIAGIVLGMGHHHEWIALGVEHEVHNLVYDRGTYTFFDDIGSRGHVKVTFGTNVSFP